MSFFWSVLSYIDSGSFFDGVLNFKLSLATSIAPLMAGVYPLLFGSENLIAAIWSICGLICAS